MSYVCTCNTFAQHSTLGQGKAMCTITQEIYSYGVLQLTLNWG